MLLHRFRIGWLVIAFNRGLTHGRHHGAGNRQVFGKGEYGCGHSHRSGEQRATNGY